MTDMLIYIFQYSLTYAPDQDYVHGCFEDIFVYDATAVGPIGGDTNVLAVTNRPFVAWAGHRIRGRGLLDLLIILLISAMYSTPEKLCNLL